MISVVVTPPGQMLENLERAQKALQSHLTAHLSSDAESTQLAACCLRASVLQSWVLLLEKRLACYGSQMTDSLWLL